MSVDVLGMLLLSLLLITSGGDVERVEILDGGVHTVEGVAGALVVTGGEVTVPAGTTVDGPVHVLEGSLDVQGVVGGDVLVLGGSVSVAADARVTGLVRHYGGDLALGPGSGARVGGVDVGATRAGPVRDVASTLLGAAALALLGWWWARRRPAAVATVGDAVRRHPVVSLTVGALVAVTGLTVLVVMAFTIVLLPVAALGLLTGVALAASGVVGVGGLVGRLLPLARSTHATAAGVAVTVVGLRVLAVVPVVGDLVGLLLVLTGLGAVLITYVGLKPFAPVVLPG